MDDRAQAWSWLALAAVAGVALVAFYPDSYQQDAGYHFLFSRFAWAHPALFVGVWSRPLFTAAYALPAQFGYPAAKLTTIVICLITAYQTYRLVRAHGVPRAPLVILFLFLQPAFLLISGDTMTEPIFALIFVSALRLHLSGRTGAGMWVASMMPLARPEGFFLCLMWGVWMLLDATRRRGSWLDACKAIPGIVVRLSAGMIVWWLAALWLTGDPLFIKHNWPPGWSVTTATYGVGPVWTYVARLPEIAGPLLLVPCVLGLVRAIRPQGARHAAAAVLTLFVVHTVLRAAGWFGSAGYARYFVCVSPAIAWLTLAGRNDIAERFAARSRRVRRAAGAATLTVSAIASLLYVDMAGFYGRDAHAVTEVYSWFTAHPRPVSQLIWSQAYMCILAGRDPYDHPDLSGDKTANLAKLRSLSGGTLVFWDDETGPAWFGLSAADFEAAGFESLRSQSFELDGRLRETAWLPWWPPRKQGMHLLYK